MNRSSRLWLVLASLLFSASAMAEIDEVERIERSLLQALTAEQVEAFLDGVSPESLELANGETLAEYLTRQDRKTRSGLVLQPVDPCVVLDTGRGFEKIVPGVDLPLVVRGEARDLTESGGSSSGCGIPGVEGEIFRANRARALLLSIEIRDAVAPGTLQVWPEGGSRSLATVVAFQPDQVTTASSLIVPICAEENADPCPEGDLRFLLDVEARVKVTIHGYLEPVVAGSIAELEEEDSAEDEETESSKSLTAPFWEQRTGSPDIYYTDGRVGIGTDSPEWTFGLGGERHPRIELLSNEADLSNEVAIGFGNADRSEYFEVGLDNEGANAFHIGSWGFAAKHFSILPNGFVGIGHTNPDSYLTVYGTAHLKSNNPNLRLSDSSVVAGDPGAVWNVRNQNSLFKIYEGFADGSPEFVIDGLGNVGIGTSAPEAALHVSSREAGAFISQPSAIRGVSNYFEPDFPTLMLHRHSSSRGAALALGNQTGSTYLYGSHGGFKIYDSERNLRLFLDQGGQLGLGTDDPQKTLHVDGSFLLRDPTDRGILLNTLQRAPTGYGGGSAHDTQALVLTTPYEKTDGTKARSSLILASPEIWGGESAYLYGFGTKNLRLGAINDSHRRAEIEIFNNNTSEGKIFFRTGSWQDPGNVPGSETNVRMLIDHSGNVGVGTTAPSEKLEVDGNIKLSGSLVSDGDLCIGHCE